MPISGLDLIRILHDHRLRTFTTGDFQTLTRLSSVAAAQALRRLAGRKLVLKMKRGLWVNQLANIHVFEVVPYLTLPWLSYVSLYSALSQYGIVAEVPHVIYAVTCGPPSKYKTAVGDFFFHHLPNHLMWGYEVRKEGESTYVIAEPEKAFLDLVYLALIPRSLLRLPTKRERRWKLDTTKLKKYVRRFQFQPMLLALKKLEVL